MNHPLLAVRGVSLHVRLPPAESVELAANHVHTGRVLLRILLRRLDLLDEVRKRLPDRFGPRQALLVAQAVQADAQSVVQRGQRIAATRTKGRGQQVLDGFDADRGTLAVPEVLQCLVVFLFVGVVGDRLFDVREQVADDDFEDAAVVSEGPDAVVVCLRPLALPVQLDVCLVEELAHRVVFFGGNRGPLADLLHSLAVLGDAEGDLVEKGRAARTDEIDQRNAQLRGGFPPGLIEHHLIGSHVGRLDCGVCGELPLLPFAVQPDAFPVKLPRTNPERLRRAALIARHHHRWVQTVVLQILCQRRYLAGEFSVQRTLLEEFSRNRREASASRCYFGPRHLPLARKAQDAVDVGDFSRTFRRSHRFGWDYALDNGWSVYLRRLLILSSTFFM